jgi:hypothetical protein
MFGLMLNLEFGIFENNGKKEGRFGFYPFSPKGHLKLANTSNLIGLT